MKHVYLLTFTLLSFSAFAQRFQIGTYFCEDFPNKQVMPKMSPVSGLGLQLGYKPFARLPMIIEAKGSFGIFSSRTMQQTYVFSSTSSTTTNVTYNSTMNKTLLGLKFQIGNDYKAVRFYVTPQIGAAYFRSRIVIDDPADQDDCKPLERKTNQHFNGMVYGGEIGMDVLMNKIFKGITSEKHRLFISASFLSGFGKFEYVNVKYMQDQSHDMMNMGDMGASSDDGRDITGTFINVSTNTLHEHKIAELYRTSLQFWGFNIGYSFNF